MKTEKREKTNLVLQLLNAPPCAPRQISEQCAVNGVIRFDQNQHFVSTRGKHHTKVRGGMQHVGHIGLIGQPLNNENKDKVFIVL